MNSASGSCNDSTMLHTRQWFLLTGDLPYNIRQPMTVRLQDIEDARLRIRDVITPTPVIADARLSREVGAHAHLKAESLQKSGSFKIRGAYNKISQLSDEEKARGVVAASAGNHAQGVALAAR